MRYIILFTACLVLVLPGPSHAQYYPRRGPASATVNAGPYNGPAVTFHGTLKAITKKQLIVDLDRNAPGDEKESLTFRLSRKTKFLKDNKEIKPSDLAVGAHIMVDATRDGDQKLSALNVTTSAEAAAGTEPRP